MRFLIFAFLFATHSFIAASQSKVTTGQPYAVIDATEKYYFSSHGEILTLKIMKKTVFLQKMNASNLSFQQVRTYDDFPKDFQIEQVAQIKNRYFLFYSLWDNNQENLFYREINFGTGTFMGSGKKLITLNEKIGGEYVKTGLWSVGVADKFDFFFSFDSSSMVVQYRLVPDKKNDSKSYDVIGMHVFDQDLTNKWANKVKMPYTEKKMDNMNYSVDGAGNVYIVARVFNDNSTDLKKRGDDDANYKLEILKVAAGTGLVTSSKVDIANKFIQTIRLYESGQSYMICAGLYNIGRTSSNADGIILFKLNPDGQIFDMNTVEIPVSILNQYASSKTQRKNKRKEEDDKAESEFMNLRSIDILDDGGVMLVGEQAYMKSHYDGRHYYYSYFYNDILVTKIDPSGKLVWMRKLPKRQMSTYSVGGMSYRYFISTENHYFMFLDNEKNLNLPMTEVPALHIDGAGGFLTAYKLNDKTGIVKKMSLLDTRDIHGMEVFQFAPYRMIATAPNTLVFEVYKKQKEDILVKIVLE